MLIAYLLIAYLTISLKLYSKYKIIFILCTKIEGSPLGLETNLVPRKDKVPTTIHTTTTSSTSNITSETFMNQGTILSFLSYLFVLYHSFMKSIINKNVNVSRKENGGRLAAYFGRLAVSLLARST